MDQIDYEKFRKSLNRLKEQDSNYKLDKKKLSEIDREGIKESVIKRFEIAYDSLWKHLKTYLQNEEGLVDLPNAPNGIFRRACSSELIDQKMLDRLMNYNKIRGEAAHDYSQKKADKILSKTGDFIKDAEYIYQIIVKEK